MSTFRYSISITVLVALALVAAGCASETNPSPLQVSMSTDLDASAADVWKIVGDFGGVDFLSAIDSVSVEGETLGAIRTLTLAGDEGGTIIERLDEFDDEGMRMAYTIIESPLPLRSYTGTMTVTERGEDGATFTWSSVFTAKDITDEEAQAFVEGFYTVGFNDLKKALGEPVEEEAAGEE